MFKQSLNWHAWLYLDEIGGIRNVAATWSGAAKSVCIFFLEKRDISASESIDGHNNILFILQNT
jgi:hypothetical protein